MTPTAPGLGAPGKPRRTTPTLKEEEETLQAVLGRYEQMGYTSQFGARPGGRILCFSCRRECSAQDVGMLAMHRLEGVSDPGDMAAVVAVQCPGCAAKGTMALSYGVEASLDDKLVLARFADRRRRSNIPPGV